MKNNSAIDCLFEITDEHCRQFIRKGSDDEGIFCGKVKVNCKNVHWTMKTECAEGSYLVRREDVHEGRVTELSMEQDTTNR